MRSVYLLLFSVLAMTLAIVITMNDSNESSLSDEATHLTPRSGPSPKPIAIPKAPSPPAPPVVLNPSPSLPAERQAVIASPTGLQVDLEESCDEAMAEEYGRAMQERAQALKNRILAEQSGARAEISLTQIRQELASLQHENDKLQQLLATERRELALIRERLLRGRGVALQ